MRYSSIFRSAFLCFSCCFVSFTIKASQDSPGTITPSELNSNAKRLDGKYVSVKGYMFDEDENTSLWNSKSASTSKVVKLDECVSIIFPNNMSKVLREFDKQEVIISGIFHKDIRHSKIIRLGLCNWSAIELVDDKIPSKIENP